MAAWIVSSRDTDEGILPWIWAVAIGLRVVVLPSEPSLTDDFWRYLWDGHVQRAGMNPYLFAPGAQEHWYDAYEILHRECPVRQLPGDVPGENKAG